jgi:hypothetical protein
MSGWGLNPFQGRDVINGKIIEPSCVRVPGCEKLGQEELQFLVEPPGLLGCGETKRQVFSRSGTRREKK